MISTLLMNSFMGLITIVSNPLSGTNSIPGASISSSRSEWVDLKLLNNSDQSIKLHIPNVMNPNLSPRSESNVSIEVGTRAYFYIKNRKYELIEITATMEKVVIVDELVKKRKAELGL